MIRKTKKLVLIALTLTAVYTPPAQGFQELIEIAVDILVNTAIRESAMEISRVVELLTKFVTKALKQLNNIKSIAPLLDAGVIPNDPANDPDARADAAVASLNAQIAQLVANQAALVQQKTGKTLDTSTPDGYAQALGYASAAAKQAADTLAEKQAGDDLYHNFNAKNAITDDLFNRGLVFNVAPTVANTDQYISKDTPYDNAYFIPGFASGTAGGVDTYANNYIGNIADGCGGGQGTSDWNWELCTEGQFLNPSSLADDAGAEKVRQSAASQIYSAWRIHSLAYKLAAYKKAQAAANAASALPTAKTPAPTPKSVPAAPAAKPVAPAPKPATPAPKPAPAAPAPKPVVKAPAPKPLPKAVVKAPAHKPAPVSTTGMSGASGASGPGGIATQAHKPAAQPAKTPPPAPKKATPAPAPKPLPKAVVKAPAHKPAPVSTTGMSGASGASGPGGTATQAHKPAAQPAKTPPPAPKKAPPAPAPKPAPVSTTGMSGASGAGG